jgi:hypothetical protein
MGIVARYYISRTLLLAALVAAGWWVWTHQGDLKDGLDRKVHDATIRGNMKIQREEEKLEDDKCGI